MTLPLANRTIALAEGRQLEELAKLLEQAGATALRCPMISILDAPDPTPVVQWLRELIAGRFDYTILMTGEGIRRLLGFAEREGLREQVIAGLANTKTITRGPKPVRALKEIGLNASIVAQQPTTEGVMAVLSREPLEGRTVGVQNYSESNPALHDFLRNAGANVHNVLPYVYAPAADGARVLDLIEQMALGNVDAIIFTSSPQVDRLYEVAEQSHLQDRLNEGLQRTKVAAVGPVVADNLKNRGANVDICPEQGFQMKNLVQHVKRAFEK